MTPRRKPFTSVPVEPSDLERLRVVKEELQQLAGRRLRWSDVVTTLLAFKEQAMGTDTVSEEPLTVVMAQEDDRPLTSEELEAMGVVRIPGIPMSLSEEDRERIAELVVAKLLERLPNLLNEAQPEEKR